MVGFNWVSRFDQVELDRQVALDRWTDGQMDGQIDRQWTDRQVGRQTGRQTRLEQNGTSQKRIESIQMDRFIRT